MTGIDGTSAPPSVTAFVPTISPCGSAATCWGETCLTYFENTCCATHCSCVAFPLNGNPHALTPFQKTHPNGAVAGGPVELRNSNAPMLPAVMYPDAAAEP